MHQGINRFWEKPGKKTFWSRVGLARKRNSSGFLKDFGGCGESKRKRPMVNFRLFWISLGFLLVIGGLVALVDGLSPRQLPTPTPMEEVTESVAEAPFRLRFSDDCGNPNFPLESDRRTVFGIVRGGHVMDQFTLTTTGRDGDDYEQTLTFGQRASLLSTHCVGGQPEPDAYVDWSGVLGSPLSVWSARESSGVRVPSDLKAGSRWITEFVIDANGLPQDKSFGASTVTVSLSNRAFIPETLMAPAGSFKVFRVLVHQKVSYVGASGEQVHEPVEQDYLEYWAKGKGLVRVHADRISDWDYVIVDSGFIQG